MAEINKLSVGGAIDKLRRADVQSSQVRLDEKMDALDEDIRRMRATRRRLENDQQAANRDRRRREPVRPQRRGRESSRRAPRAPCRAAGQASSTTPRRPRPRSDAHAAAHDPPTPTGRPRRRARCVRDRRGRCRGDGRGNPGADRRAGGAGPVTDVLATSVAPPTPAATPAAPTPLRAAAKTPYRPSSAPVHIGAFTIFACLSLFFASRMAAGEDPALGLPPGALAKPAPPGVVQRVVITRRVSVDGLTRAQIRRRGIHRVIVVRRPAAAPTTVAAVARRDRRHAHVRRPRPWSRARRPPARRPGPPARAAGRPRPTRSPRRRRPLPPPRHPIPSRRRRPPQHPSPPRRPSPPHPLPLPPRSRRPPHDDHHERHGRRSAAAAHGHADPHPRRPRRAHGHAVAGRGRRAGRALPARLRPHAVAVQARLRAVRPERRPAAGGPRVRSAAQRGLGGARSGRALRAGSWTRRCWTRCSAAGYVDSWDGARRLDLADAIAELPPGRRAAAPDPASRWREIAVDDVAGTITRPPGPAHRHRRQRQGSRRRPGRDAARGLRALGRRLRR